MELRDDAFVVGFRFWGHLPQCRDNGRHQQQQDNDHDSPTSLHNHQQNLQPTLIGSGDPHHQGNNCNGKDPDRCKQPPGARHTFVLDGDDRFPLPMPQPARHANRTSPQDKEVQVGASGTGYGHDGEDRAWTIRTATASAVFAVVNGGGGPDRFRIGKVGTSPLGMVDRPRSHRAPYRAVQCRP